MTNIILTILGLVFSVGGFTVTIWQVVKTRRVAAAAKQAAENAQSAIKRNVMLADMSSCSKTLDQIKQYVRDRKTEPALMRVTDLMLQLSQLAQAYETSEGLDVFDFQGVLTHLNILREELERNHARPETPLKPVRINATLTNLSVRIESFIGKEKFAIDNEGGLP
jgi:hypothetical protein